MRRPLLVALVFFGTLVLVVSVIVISSNDYPTVLKKVVEKSDPQNLTKKDFEIKASPSQQNKPSSQRLFSIEILPTSSLAALSKKDQTKHDFSVPSRNVYRRAIFKPISAQQLRSLSVGSSVTFPLFDGVIAQGHVVLNRAASAEEPAAISGAVQSPFEGSFALVDDPRLGWQGFIIPKQGERAYEFETYSDGNVYLDEVPRDNVVCGQMTPPPGFVLPKPLKESGTSSPAAVPPSLRSRPGAPGTLFLDFDGAVVTDPRWNNGATVQAKHSGLSVEEMTNIWKAVAEDYLPFGVNVTTVESDYTVAKQGMRMRCVFTPSRISNAPNAGTLGVAYLGSFKWSGTTPSWAFLDSYILPGSPGASRAAALVAAHELGHTFNLSHDGTSALPYFAGHGSGATSWGPIMGNPFAKSVHQWSKGDYADANNKEDDVAIISGTYFGVGYVVDDYADSISQASVIPQSTKGVVAVSGLISSASDKDVFRLECSKGTVTISAAVAIPDPDLDVKIELLNGTGAVLQSSDPAGVQTATLSASVTTQGTYYLRVSSGAEPDGSTAGWTTYGSIGAYSLSGTFPSNVGFADNFADAASLPSNTSFNLQASSSLATRETSEPAHAGQTATKSLWWKWTAIGNGRLQINTKGSGFDTVLAVYTGSSLASLRAVTSNDNAVTGVKYSQVDFTTTRGTTYYFAVDGKSGASGAITLTGSGTSLSGPSNDNFTSASVVSGTTWKASGSNFNATRETDEPNHGGTSGYASVWFQWTPTTSGFYTLTTSGSGFDTLLGVYTGTEINALTLVGTNNNSAAGVTWSKIRFAATAGTAYSIAVDGANRSSGRYSLTLSK